MKSMKSKREIREKIRYLQRILVAMSSNIKNDRPELYSNILESLEVAQKMLVSAHNVENGLKYEK